MHKLDVFDFDDTLFKTPVNTPENQRKYEEATGLPWVIDKQRARFLSKKLGRHVGMRRGWWGRKETLEPPLVPDPAPEEMFNPKVCEAFLESKRDPETITMMMTGRYLGLSSHVLRILGDGGLVEVTKQGDKYVVNDPDVVCMFLGADGPKPQGTKPSETLPWKFWILDQYVDLYPLKRIRIWEDRVEHAIEFEKYTVVEELVVYHVQPNGNYFCYLTGPD